MSVVVKTGYRFIFGPSAFSKKNIEKTLTMDVVCSMIFNTATTMTN